VGGAVASAGLRAPSARAVAGPPRAGDALDDWYAAQTGEERRLRIVLGDEPANDLEAALRGRLPRAVELYRSKDRSVDVFCAAGAARRLRRLMEQAIHEAGRSFPVLDERWNWQTACWQDHRLPVPPEPPPPVRLAHPDSCVWEVQVHVDWWRGNELAEEMRKAGFLALSSRPGVLVAVRDEAERDAATAWAHEHRPEARVTIRRLHWFRHWQWRESLFGNYAMGGVGPLDPLAAPVTRAAPSLTEQIDPPG
jgi:hypothetical protein